MPSLTVEGYAMTWLAEARARVNPRSYGRYRSVYERHIQPALGARALDSVSRAELRELVRRRLEQGANPAMLVQLLSSIFGQAYDDGLIPMRVTRGLGRSVRGSSRRRTRKALTADELRRFLLAASSPYCLLFRTMAYSGLRPGEARALEVRSVAMRSIQVERTFSGDVLSETTKTEGSRRRVEIPEELGRELVRHADTPPRRRWLHHRDGNFLRERSIVQACHRTAHRAGLPASFTPHALRHTYASLLIQQGAPITYVQRQLGHRSIQMTVDVYGRWLEMRRPGELRRLVASTSASQHPERSASRYGEASSRHRCCECLRQFAHDELFDLFDDEVSP